jgi:hypothetical protein
VRLVCNDVGLKGAFCYALAGVTAWLCSAAFAQDVVTETWTTLNLRRTPAIQLDEFGYGDTLSPVNIEKLTDDSIVVTFQGLPPKKKLLFVLSVLCEAEGGTWVSDASLLRPDETAEEFVEANLRFGLPAADNLRFTLCMKAGMEWVVQEHKTPNSFVQRSEDRVIAHLNRWAWFLARRADPRRAGEFLARSLTMQMDALSAVIDSPKIDKLHLKLSYFDQTEPLAVLETGVIPPQVILRRYLEFTTRARRKLLAFYPGHRERLEGELAILKGLGASDR